MKLRDYAQLLAIYMVHLLTLAFRVNVTYHVRKLSMGYKRSETRGVSVKSFESPFDALSYIRKAVPSVKQASLFFILAEARFAFTPAVVENGDEEFAINPVPAKIGDTFGEEAARFGLGVHPAATPAAEPGRVLADRGEVEELLDVEASRRD